MYARCGRVLFVALLALARPIAAQPATDGARATLVVTVVTVVRDSAQPVVGATVEITNNGPANRAARTDSLGRARFDGLNAGIVELRVRRLGLSAATLHARIASGRNELTAQLDGSIATLDPVRVIGDRTVDGRLEDFDTRVARGEPNAFVLRDQIEHRNPISLSQMLRGMAGLHLSDSAGYKVAISTRGMKLEKGRPVPCVLRMSIDGVIMPPLTDIDAVVPRDVYGVEVYYGAARIPLQFGGMRTDQWCGLIAIWTRRD